MFYFQIGDLTDNYLFEHPHVQRRSAEHSEEHHQLLTSHPQVKASDNTFLLLDFSLTVKVATLIIISGRGSAISSAKEGKSGFIYNLVKS